MCQTGIEFIAGLQSPGMRLPDLLSAITLNIVLALFSMVMAIVALGLLVFVLAKVNSDSYLQKEVPASPKNDKIRRHESVVVDFKNPSTIPEHFLELNTLMFQKKPKNNQVTQMPGIVPLSGMDAMSSSSNEEQLVEGDAPASTADSEDIASNKVSSVLRAQRSASGQESTPQSPSSFVTDSGISDEDYSSDSTNSVDDKPRVPKEAGQNDERQGSGWVEESSTIEPPAQKVTVHLECGSEFSLC